MTRRSPNLEEPEAIQMVLQRLCRDSVPVRLAHGPWFGEFPILAVDPTGLVIALPGRLAGQWGVRRGEHLSLDLVDRGKAYEAPLVLVSTLAFKGEASCRFEMPRALRARDPHRLAEYVPGRPHPCVFTSASFDVVEGRATAFGFEGLEAGPLEARDTARLLKPGLPSTLEIQLGERGFRFPCRVQYLDNACAGFLFEGLDPEEIGAYQSWLLEAERAQARRDREAFDARGTEALGARTEQVPKLGGRVQVWSERQPHILVVSEGDALPRRLSESLGRKYGFSSLDYVQGPVHPLLGALGAGLEDWGDLRLVLVHQRLRVASGLDLTRQLTQSEACPLPVLLVGSEEDAAVKRNRAIAAGAVDFLVVEPYHVVSVMQALETTLRMFA